MMTGIVKNTLRQVVPLRQKQMLIRYALANGAEVGFDHLASKGFKPGGAIDVGAYHGEWTRAFSRVFRSAPVLMVEAQAEKKRALELAATRIGDHVEVEMALLSIRAGLDVPFFMMETGSSIYPENTTAIRRTVILRTQTLDDVVALHPALKPPLLLKLDVQGAELDVLRGGSATMRQAEFVMLEISVLDYNAGSPGLTEVLEFMSGEGFALFDITNLIRARSGDLCQIDAIFVRATSAFRPSGLLA